MSKTLFDKDYFSLLDMPLEYDIDLDLLQAHYKKLQRFTHPDRYANKSAMERRLALQTASRVNQAYQALKDPVQRAIYLLSLRGIEIDLETNTQMLPEFLMQQMTWREKINARDLSVKPEIDGAYRARYEKLCQLLSESSDTDVAAHSGALIAELQFIRKLQRELKNKT